MKDDEMVFLVPMHVPGPRDLTHRPRGNCSPVVDDPVDRADLRELFHGKQVEPHARSSAEGFQGIRDGTVFRRP